jgi:hypothetical protein
MKFDLQQPCQKCPFRTDIKPFIRGDRAAEIAESLMQQEGSFPCHVTTRHDDDGEYVPRSDGGEQHCAGALIMLEKMNRPNQMMRWMERIGGYYRRKLKMDAPIYDSARAFIARHRKAAR